MTTREILVTHALPYANGPLHIGHLLGYIQSDIWVRAMRMAGNRVHFVAADDVHGTPIMLAAEKAGMAPEEFIKGVQVSHERDFADFGVAHDFYYTTHSPENRQLAEVIYRRLRDASPSHIARRAVRQFYDPVKQMFLPDRYIKGECPNCGTPDQYGDNCENCGATYAPTDLKNPRSVVSGATPELRDSEHYFFKLGDFTDFLRSWLAGDVAHPSVKAKLKEWLDADGGLRDWDISRDAPYFGFPIPDAPGKFFYVWLDAPIGYLASFKKYCASGKNGLSVAYFDEFMQPSRDGARAMHHFLGKDIVNFHGLFWPAMLQGAGLRIPDALHVNGYLTVNGEKMSKSRGTFILARTYLDAGLNPDYLRYYFATMLTAAPLDVDLDLKAFEERVNSHLVGKFVNLASRASGFVSKYFGGALALSGSNRFVGYTLDLDMQIVRDSPHIRGWYEEGNFSFVAKTIMGAVDDCNRLWNNAKPWELAKDPNKHMLLHAVASEVLLAFHHLAVCLFPICPALSRRALDLFGLERDPTFDDLGRPPQIIRPFTSLLDRIDPSKIETMIEASKENLQPSARSPSVERSPVGIVPPPQSPAATSTIDDFAKLDLRIGTVLECGFVEGSDKLLRFVLDAGELGQRQIFSGIRASYSEPERLLGRSVVFIANLAPRKMRFGVSEGMILSAGGDASLFLLDADAGAKPGMPVK